MNYNFSEQHKPSVNSAIKGKFTHSATHSIGRKKQRPLLSIIVPVYNEQEVIENCHQRIEAVADSLPLNTEIIYINDGSNDESLQLLHAMRKKHKRMAIIDLSRNFGKEVAMTAGLDHAKGDAVIILDADLQDPPELIPQMITEWQRGYDIVYMKRTSRQGETWLKQATAHTFYRLIARISHIDIPQGVGDFRLLSRRAVDSLCQLRESNRFMKGLFAWLGFKQKEILYDRDERISGNSKWNYRALWNLALEGITSFSTAPLKLASYIGLFSLLAALLASLWVGIKFLSFNEPVSATVLLSIGLIFFAGLQMIILGIMGEYLGRIYMESKKRPLYLVNHWNPANNGEALETDDERLLTEHPLS